MAKVRIKMKISYELIKYVDIPDDEISMFIDENVDYSKKSSGFDHEMIFVNFFESDLPGGAQYVEVLLCDFECQRPDGTYLTIDEEEDV